MSLISEPPTPPTRTSEALRAQLQHVNAQLATIKQQWDDEKEELLGENAVLQDAAHRLNTEIRDTKKELKKLADTGKAGEHARVSVQEVSSTCHDGDGSDGPLYAGARAREACHR